MVQSNVSPGAFTHFMETLDGAEPHFSQETVDDLILLAQEFGQNGLIASLVPQRDVPRHEENVYNLLQEFNRDFRSTTIDADLQSIRDSLGVMQRRISVMKEKFGENLEKIMSELEDDPIFLSRHCHSQSLFTGGPQYRAALSHLSCPWSWLIIRFESMTESMRSPISSSLTSRWGIRTRIPQNL
jgi:hypothetical protein